MSIGPTSQQIVSSSMGDFAVSASITERTDGEFDIDTSISEVRAQIASIPVVLTFSTSNITMSGAGLTTIDAAIFRRYRNDDGLRSLNCEVDLETFESVAHMIYLDGVEADGAAVESFAIEAATLVRELTERNPRIVQELTTALARSTGAALQLISLEQRSRADRLLQSADRHAHAADEAMSEPTYAPSR